MRKVIIIGNAGSGKTWLGTRIANVLEIPLVALDGIFWEPGGYNKKRNDTAVAADLKSIGVSGCWVVEGVFGHLVDQLIPFCDTLIYLDLPWEACRKNLMHRGSESSKPLDPVTAEENFKALLDWASKYETRDSKASQPYHRFLFDGFGGEKHRVCSRDQMDPLLETIRANRAEIRDQPKLS